MPTALPYVISYGKIQPLFDKVKSAKVPDSFSQTFLAESLGFTSSADRALIPLMRSLGFIDASGKPTPSYNKLKNSATFPIAIADSVRKAFAPLFGANEKANELQNAALKGLVAQVSGTDENLTGRIAGTFKALVELSDFNSVEEEKAIPPEEKKDVKIKEDTPPEVPISVKPVKPEFHYNIQVHLPTNATEETYLNIFNAIRKSFT